MKVGTVPSFPLSLASFLLVGYSLASPLPQEVVATVASATSSNVNEVSTAPASASSASPSSPTTTKSKSLLPLVVLGVLAVLLAIALSVFMLRKRFAALFKKNSTTPTANQNDPPAVLETVQTNSTTNSSPLSSVSGARPAPRPPAAGVGNGDRPAGQERRRRRTPRPPSVVGLPLYTEDPNHDELVLVKHRPKFSLNDEDGEAVDLLAYDRSLDEDGEGEEEGIDYEDETTGSLMRMAQREVDEMGVRRPSMDSSSASFIIQGRSRSASDALSSDSSPRPSFDRRPHSPDRIRNAIDISNPSLSSSPAPSTSSSLYPTGHRLTQSLSVPSMAGTSPPSTPQQTIIIQNRSRSSTLRSMFTRSSNGSSSFLPLRNSPSNDAIGPGAGRSPYGQGSLGAGGSRSTARLASASTTSISSLNISAPLQNTLVHSQFVFPKNGLTASQIAFISSRESLGAYGYGPGSTEPPAFEEMAPTISHDSSTSSPTSLSPPAIQGRGRRSSSVTSVRSPLATAPPLELHPPPPEYPPAIATTYPPTLSAIRTTSLTPPPPPTPPALEMAERSSTGAPLLPAIELLVPTPTNSAAPSPILPSPSSPASSFTRSMFSHSSRAAQVSTISEGSFRSGHSPESSEEDRALLDHTSGDQGSFTAALGNGSHFLS